MSPWEPKADLPPEYSRIFAFDSFARVAKESASESTHSLAAPVGSLVTIVLKEVPVIHAKEAEKK